MPREEQGRCLPHPDGVGCGRKRHCADLKGQSTGLPAWEALRTDGQGVASSTGPASGVEAETAQAREGPGIDTRLAFDKSLRLDLYVLISCVFHF